MPDTAGRDPFFSTARSLARNPLGIIALFIVLVYAVAGIVIGLAKPEFYANPLHPAVLFLAIFPMVVLLVFAHLVIRHHRNLYAPGDYKDESHFLRGVPEQLQNALTGVATSDSETREVDAGIAESIHLSYTELVEFGFVIVHRAEVVRERTAPMTGVYRVRVWVEPLGEGRSIDEVGEVTYHVWPDFSRSIVTTTERKSSFELWLNVYGEFPLLAVVVLRDGTQRELQRYIDLPGRPPD